MNVQFIINIEQVEEDADITAMQEHIQETLRVEYLFNDVYVYTGEEY